MARKSIKGYAEKNYYDNTRFTGGIVATHDPLNEGYFRHMTNFDISDMGQSLTPRKGFHTTILKASNNSFMENISIEFNTYIDMKDITPSRADITIYISGIIDHPEWVYLSTFKHLYTVQQSILISYGDLYMVEYDVTFVDDGIKFTTVYEYPSSFNFTVPWDGSQVEVHLSGNTDCTPTTFITTIPRIDVQLKENSDKVNISLSKQLIYFYDTNLNEYIFLDLYNSTPYFKQAWRVSLDMHNMFIESCKHITNIDTTDLDNMLYGCNLNLLQPINTLQALRIVDENLITSYIIKVEYNKKLFWLKMFYRKNSTDTLLGDTLVLSYLDTEDIVNYVDPTQRNLSSTQDIIPVDMQRIYNEEDRPLGFVQEFPMIYVKDSNGNYLINTTKELNGLELIPHFYIEYPGDNYYWAYTYDVTRMHPNANLSSEQVYNSVIYTLDTNEQIDPDKYTGTSEDTVSDVYQMYLNKRENAFNDYFVSYFDYNVFKYDLTETQYFTILNKCYVAQTQVLGDVFVLYVVPKPNTDNPLHIPVTPTEDHSNVNLGVGGLSSYFGGERMYVRLSVPNVTSSYIIESEDDWDVFKTYLKDSTYSAKYIKDLHDTVLDIHNNNNYILSEKYCNYIESYNVLEQLRNASVDTLRETLEQISNTHDFYIRPYSSLQEYTEATTGIDSIFQTAMNSSIITFETNYEDSELNTQTVDDLYKKYFTSLNYRIIFNVMTTSTVAIMDTYTNNDSNNEKSNYIKNIDPNLQKVFPNIVTDKVTQKNYIICTNMGPIRYPDSFYLDVKSHTHGTDIIDSIELITNLDDMIYSQDTTTSYAYTFNNLFKPCSINEKLTLTLYPYCDPIRNAKIVNFNGVVINSESLFTIDNKDDNLKALLNNSNDTYKDLEKAQYFNTGLNLTFYLLKIPKKDYIEKNPTLFPDFKYDRNILINSTSLYNSRQIILSKDEPTTYVRTLVEDPDNIKNAKDYVVFDSLLGEHFVVYKDNALYISKENKPHYFPESYKKVYSEPIVKALPYKDLLLVFTTQNLYAVYLYETTTNVENGTNEDGTIKYVQQKVYNFASLPVLYNIMVNEKYKDAIQVYNQMILFYSADGQMFLIKPTAAIDSNTRFSIQYFNKSANDILLNYKQYIQERLIIYGIDPNIKDEDITIKVIANINHIKIFYNVPGKITYILVYDVLNNRYYTYDTVSFSDVKNIHYTPNGEVYLTEHDNKLYFTSVNQNKNGENVDTAYYNNFSPMPIQCEIDTGTINLNNHLKKRFKDLRVIYKNLDANELEFKLETFVDDIPIITYVDTCLEIRDVSGYSTLTVTEINKVIQLLKDKSLLIPDFEESSHLIENNALFNFSSYSSNKIITHRTNIVSKGKAIRFKMNFSSKGKYKIQGYGIIYKEHTV